MINEKGDHLTVIAAKLRQTCFICNIRSRRTEIVGTAKLISERQFDQIERSGNTRIAIAFVGSSRSSIKLNDLGTRIAVERVV